MNDDFPTVSNMKYRMYKCTSHEECWTAGHLSTARVRFHATMCKPNCVCWMHGVMETHEFYQILEGGYLG